MKYILCFFLFICITTVVLFAQQDLPISAFQCNNTSWFEGAGEDSLGLNLIHYGWKKVKKQTLLDALDAAYSENLKLIMNNATKDSSGRGDLRWYCQLHHGHWEAEDSSNFFWEDSLDYWNGEVVYDTTPYDTVVALVAFVDSLDPCDMLRTRCDHTQQYDSLKVMNVIFRLRIDSLSWDTLRPDVPVCSLYITKVGFVLLTGKVIRADSFYQANQYQTCTLSYTCPDTNNQLYYGLYWFDNCDLWCDYIEAKDPYIDSLVISPYYYNGILDDITRIYDDDPALAYYYLLDEPRRSYLEANVHVMQFLGPPGPHKPGIQTVSFSSPTWYRTYVDSVDPNVLTIDFYPLKGDLAEEGPTPVESGEVFQRKVDTMCIALDSARTAAKQKGIPFWFVCQSFGQYTDTSTYKVREPTPRELKCMLWLALAHGAKGIDHFLYRSYKEEHGTIWWYDSGLTYNDNGLPRETLWTAAKEMNFVMREIGPQLLADTCDSVFKSSEGIPPCFIEHISPDDTVQIGTFHANNDTFFVMVNRLCTASDSDTVVIKIYKDSLFLFDLYTKETILPDSEPNGKACFSIPIPPAEGRFLQLVPFAHNFKINNDQPFTNMRFAALNTKAWPSESIDSMKITQTYRKIDTLTEYVYSTGWIPYDTAYCWYLREKQYAENELKIQYKVDGYIETPIYYDSIILDTIAPTGSFVINEGDMFTNNPTVTLSNSFTDTKSGMAQMRYLIEMILAKCCEC